MAASIPGLLSWIRQQPAYTRLREACQTDLALPPYPVMPRVRPAIMAALADDLDVPVLILVPTIEESRRTQETLRLWVPDPQRLRHFPEPPGLFYERAPWSPETIADRLDILSSLAMIRAGEAGIAPPIIVASTRALMQRTLPYRQFRKAVQKIDTGTRLPLSDLTRHAAGIGYEPVSVVQSPGQMSRRGGLLDIYPPQSTEPYRLEFYGDEIETIRAFDPDTQRSTHRVEGFWLAPVREALPQDAARALPVLEALKQSTEAADLRAQLTADSEALAAGLPFPNLETYLPYLYQETGTLLHYLPDDALVILSDGDVLPEHWRALEEEAEEQRRTQTGEGQLSESSPVPYVAWNRMRDSLDRLHTLQLNSGEEGPLAEAIGPEPHFAGRLSDALGRIRQWINLGDQVVIASRQAERMAELWQESAPPKVHEALPTAPDGPLTFVHAAVPGGWQWLGPEGVRHLITDEELFGWSTPEPRRRTRRRATTPEYSFADLQDGDLVVHEDYGIGIFRGLVTRNVDEIEREYLLLEYAAPADRTITAAYGAVEEEKPQSHPDLLYVPIHQADRLTRYVGAEGLGPHLSRLSGGTWTITKAKVQESANELAQELLELYAKRQVVHGYAFAPDTAWQHELEAAFPYVETDDQVEAIHAVKTDMERPRPMDRLICGDAGYGKTEVALRAAFKAVMAGKQVAVLVPTTVLAQQHYETFQERLSSFPVRLELLSRFRTESEQLSVLEALAQGGVDIVIGTHRLLQRDVEFRDLGLVIIDEEQRFGVAHKERLKEMRTEVDVLTLTATPIPRTLYMALTGVRDISIIETPPQERLPIVTYVGPHSADIARRAILREVRRGGQVFYVHNRVESIITVEVRLKELVPEVRIGVAHGQMHEHELSDVMHRFDSGDVDLLLATTIIESGLDFPNANTLIVERADRFGLAQLYQLRGRIGRGTRRGYAYFFHKRRMNEEAAQRLLALRETSSQGGGFSVALRDLEIRGAGDLLGHRQHGHIAAVGFTLYTRILSRAVGQLKAEISGEPAPPEPIGSITIELPLAVGLSPEYIPDDGLRLQLYRRLAELTTEHEISTLREELEDRFGALPPTAENLLYQLRLKVLARDARIPSIAVENGQIALRPTWLQNTDPNRIAQLRQALGDLARVGRREIWLTLSWDQSGWRERVRRALELIVDWWQNAGQDPKTPESADVMVV